MPRPKDVLEAKKAAIKATADKQIAEIDADMLALEQITSKYDLDVVARDNTSTVLVEMKLTKAGSNYQRAKSAGEAFIKAAGKPVQLNEIYEEIVRLGIEIGGKTPKNTLSAYLGQNPNLESTSHGWWLAGVPYRRVKFL